MVCVHRQARGWCVCTDRHVGGVCAQMCGWCLCRQACVWYVCTHRHVGGVSVHRLWVVCVHRQACGCVCSDVWVVCAHRRYKWCACVQTSYMAGVWCFLSGEWCFLSGVWCFLSGASGRRGPRCPGQVKRTWSLTREASESSATVPSASAWPDLLRCSLSGGRLPWARVARSRSPCLPHTPRLQPAQRAACCPSLPVASAPRQCPPEREQPGPGPRPIPKSPCSQGALAGAEAPQGQGRPEGLFCARSTHPARIPWSPPPAAEPQGLREDVTSGPSTCQRPRRSRCKRCRFSSFLSLSSANRLAARHQRDTLTGSPGRDAAGRWWAGCRVTPQPRPLHAHRPARHLQAGNLGSGHGDSLVWVDALCPVTWAAGGVGVVGRSWGQASSCPPLGFCPPQGRPLHLSPQPQIWKPSKRAGSPKGPEAGRTPSSSRAPLSQLLPEASSGEPGGWGRSTDQGPGRAPRDLATGWPSVCPAAGGPAAARALHPCSGPASRPLRGHPSLPPSLPHSRLHGRTVTPAESKLQMAPPPHPQARGRVPRAMLLLQQTLPQGERPATRAARAHTHTARLAGPPLASAGSPAHSAPGRGPRSQGSAGGGGARPSFPEPVRRCGPPYGCPRHAGLGLPAR